jgi:hypothetical protein
MYVPSTGLIVLWADLVIRKLLWDILIGWIASGVLFITRRWAARVAVVSMVATAVILNPAASAVGDSDRLPDLGMGRLGNLSIDTTTIPGRAFCGSRRSSPMWAGTVRDDWEAPGRQRIYDDAGSYRESGTSAVMFYSGDGHNRWHVRDAEAYELNRLNNGAKHGFCYYDNTRYRLSLAGAPPDPVYRGCGTQSA